MTTPTPGSGPEVEVSPEARDALLAHLAADPLRTLVRIHVGRG